MIENININDATVSAELHGFMYTALYGYNGVLNIGSKLACAVITNNLLQLEDGFLINHGRFMKLSGSENITIENGATGTNRVDLIVAHFETDGINETHDIRVIKGEPGGVIPAETTEDIYNGGIVCELPLYEVHLEGLTITKTVQRFETIVAIEELRRNASNANLIANGDFQLWEKGETFSNIANQYTANRWQIRNAAGSTLLVERSSEAPGEFKNSIHIQEENTENSYLSQHFIRPEAGTLTLTFWYKATVDFNSYYYKGTEAVHLGKNLAAAEWKKAHYTFEAENMVTLNIIHAVSAGDIYITGVKLERGETATPYKPRTYEEELCAAHPIMCGTTEPEQLEDGAIFLLIKE